MDLIQRIRQEAAKKSNRIVLPESHDLRTLKAAEYLSKHKICDVVLIGDESYITVEATRNDINLGNIEIQSPENSSKLSQYSESFYEKRKAKGVTESQAKKIVSSELFLRHLWLHTEMLMGV